MVPRPVLMGARVSLAEDQTPLGTSAAEVVRRLPSGDHVPMTVPEPESTVLAVVHFVELDDGRRVTTQHLGEMSLHMSLDCSQAELRDEVREFVYEDEMREIPELAHEPRWQDMIAALARHEVDADEASLAALPFTVELDEQVLARLPGESP